MVVLGFGEIFQLSSLKNDKLISVMANNKLQHNITLMVDGQLKTTTTLNHAFHHSMEAAVNRSAHFDAGPNVVEDPSSSLHPIIPLS